MPSIVGIDFDNTLVDYDDVMHRAAVRIGFIGNGVPTSKRDIRDEIRRLPDGEMKWRKLQAFVYGEAMDEARLMKGVRDFFELCRRTGIRICIVSHKTEFAAADEKRINLRQVALEWMNKQRFFADDGFGLSRRDVYFEATRREKIERIRELGCTHFIDDLEETFLEDSFPRGVRKFLFAPRGGNVALDDVRVSRTWHEIKEYFSGQKNENDKADCLQKRLGGICKDHSRSFVLWFTGLSGAGKSTLADKVYNYLKEKDIKVERLDGDAVRAALPDLGFTKEERNNHIKYLGFLASMLERNGIVAIASFISPYQETRDIVRRLCRNFIEVYVKTPLEVCERRDVKGLYKKARQGEIRNFTGVSDPYEGPVNSEIVIETEGRSVEESFLVLRDYVDRHLLEGKNHESR